MATARHLKGVRVLRWISTFIILLALAVAPPLAAQQSRSPFITVRILARESQDQIRTVRFFRPDGVVLSASGSDGSYTIARPEQPQVVRVAAVGFEPGEVTISPDWVGPLVVTLDALITRLGDLSTAGSIKMLQGGDNTWVVDATVAEAVPVTVEPDVFRALALTPSVSFSSLRSSRPLIRGVDADDTGFSIDGHEVVNLYHIGRSFAGFPQIAAARVSVASQPSRIDVGRTISGRVEIEGVEWSQDRPTELQYGLGAWSAITGWSNGAASAVVAGRTIAGSVVGASVASGISDVEVYDLYSRLDINLLLPVRVTAFRSIDRGTDPDPKRGETSTLDWSASLLGVHAELIRNSSLLLEVSGAYASRSERGKAVPARQTIVELDNENERIGGKVDGSLRVVASGPTIRFGVDLASRHLRNVILPHESGRFVSRDYDHTGTETGGYLDIETALIGGTLRSGVRFDGFDDVAALQPRLSFVRPLGRRMWASVAAGRAARLVHLISDARVEPKVGYYDIWLPANDTDVPVASADHLTAELGWANAQNRFRLGVFTSDGEGMLDLVGGNFSGRNVGSWRTGRSRVVGAEMEAGASSRDQRWSGQLSYTLAKSERDWGDGWVPWINDRLHQLRLSGHARPLRHTTVSPSVELSSGQPYTPFVRVDQVGRSAQALFGSENSARGNLGVRLGAAVQQALDGPFDTELNIGVSVTNVGFGDQSPREAAVRFVPMVAGGPLQGALPSSRQVSELPAIPSVLVNVRF